MRDEALSDVVKTGNQRRSLEVIRDCLAAAIDSAKYAKDLPPLTKQLADVIEKLEALPDARRESKVDDLAKHRAARRKKAAGDSAQAG